MHTAGNDYLTTEIMTASPEKLQLMLVEAALRLGWQVRQHWQVGAQSQAHDAMIRMQQVVSEMIAGLDTSRAPRLAAQIASVYLFIYRALVEASFESSDEKLGQALRILETERETWRLASQQAPRSAPLDAMSTLDELGQSFVA